MFILYFCPPEVMTNCHFVSEWFFFSLIFKKGRWCAEQIDCSFLASNVSVAELEATLVSLLLSSKGHNTQLGIQQQFHWAGKPHRISVLRES